MLPLQEIITHRTHQRSSVCLVPRDLPSLLFGSAYLSQLFATRSWISPRMSWIIGGVGQE